MCVNKLAYMLVAFTYWKLYTKPVWLCPFYGFCLRWYRKFDHEMKRLSVKLFGLIFDQNPEECDATEAK
jgi:hypothetical protein